MILVMGVWKFSAYLPTYNGLLVSFIPGDLALLTLSLLETVIAKKSFLSLNFESVVLHHTIYR